MKKLLIVVVIIILGLCAAIILPWDRLSGIRDKLVGTSEAFSSLKVYSLSGQMKIFVDGEEKGQANQNESYFEVFPISVGEHEIMLKRESSSEDFYTTFEKKLNFEKGVDTVISWELGPTEESSSGWILSAKKSIVSTDNALISIQTIPQDSTIELNGELQNDTIIAKKDIDLNQQYTVTVSKEGYQELSFELLPENSEERLKLKGYELVVEVYLYTFPF